MIRIYSCFFKNPKKKSKKFDLDENLEKGSGPLLFFAINNNFSPLFNCGALKLIVKSLSSSAP
jgi:hypothetical protein